MRPRLNTLSPTVDGLTDNDSAPAPAPKSASSMLTPARAPRAINDDTKADVSTLCNVVPSFFSWLASTTAAARLVASR